MPLCNVADRGLSLITKVSRLPAGVESREMSGRLYLNGEDR